MLTSDSKRRFGSLTRASSSSADIDTRRIASASAGAPSVRFVPPGVIGDVTGTSEADPLRLGPASEPPEPEPQNRDARSPCPTRRALPLVGDTFDAPDEGVELVGDGAEVCGDVGDAAEDGEVTDAGDEALGPRRTRPGDASPLFVGERASVDPPPERSGDSTPRADGRRPSRRRENPCSVIVRVGACGRPGGLGDKAAGGCPFQRRAPWTSRRRVPEMGAALGFPDPSLCLALEVTSHQAHFMTRFVLRGNEQSARMILFCIRIWHAFFNAQPLQTILQHLKRSALTNVRHSLVPAARYYLSEPASS